MSRRTHPVVRPSPIFYSIIGSDINAREKRSMKIDYPQFTPKLSKTRLALCLVYAFVMGRWYNKTIGEIQDAGNEWDNRAPLVGVGVLFTILALYPLFHKRVFWTAFFLFVASGTPMMLGSAKRKNQALNLMDDWRSEFDYTLSRLERRWTK